jgi:excisionase family DNA binding protein
MNISQKAPIKVGYHLVEPFHTIKQAAGTLGLQYHQLQRGIKAGMFPAYRVGSRLRVRLSEIVAVIEASKVGGQK